MREMLHSNTMIKSVGVWILLLKINEHYTANRSNFVNYYPRMNLQNFFLFSPFTILDSKTLTTHYSTVCKKRLSNYKTIKIFLIMVC